jgi:hypothetical protein
MVSGEPGPAEATARRSGSFEEELPYQLGKIRLNLDEPGTFTSDLPTGEQSGPRLGAVHRKLGPDVDRHVAVRIALADDRAHESLRREAKHLPTSAPGLSEALTQKMCRHSPPYWIAMRTRSPASAS